MAGEAMRMGFQSDHSGGGVEWRVGSAEAGGRFREEFGGAKRFLKSPPLGRCRRIRPFSALNRAPAVQQTRTVRIPNRRPSFPIFAAMWPTPTAQWWAGPSAFQSFMKRRAPIGKR